MNTNCTEGLQLGRENRGQNAQAVINVMHNEYCCPEHKKRIFNCRVGSVSGGLYYEACCLNFRDIISKEIDRRFWTW